MYSFQVLLGIQYKKITQNTYDDLYQNLKNK